MDSNYKMQTGLIQCITAFNVIWIFQVYKMLLVAACFLKSSTIAKEVGMEHFASNHWAGDSRDIARLKYVVVNSA